MKFFRQLRSAFRRKTLDAEMFEEMRAHLEMQVQQNLTQGMSEEDARFAARRAFGGVDQIKELAREQRGFPWLDQTLRDFRHAVRQLRRSPLFTGFAVLTLALGIGAATAIYSVVHALLLSPLRYDAPDRLVQLLSKHPEKGVAGLAPATFRDLAAGNRSFAGIAAQYYYYVNLTRTETPALLNSADVSADYFTLFNVAAAHGRVWTADDVKAGAPPVVVLSDALWRSQFGGSEAIMGKEILLDDVAFTVIGVMPPAFKDPGEVAQLWRPMRPGADNFSERNSRYFAVYARTKAGVMLAEANSELDVFAQQLARSFPSSDERWTLQALELHGRIVGEYRTGLYLLLGAVGCVVVITAANLSGLSIVRAVARRKELAIRTALGSSRGQLVRHLLTESLLVALLGGVAGVLVAKAGLAALLASLPPGWVPRADEIALNRPVLVTALAVAMAAGVFAGIVPGLFAAQVRPGDALKDGMRGTANRSAGKIRSALIVIEIALALVLLAGTGLLGRSFVGLMRKPTGVDAARVLSLTVSLPNQRYNDRQKCGDFFSRAEREVARLPGVEVAGFTQTSPFRWGIPLAFVPVDSGNGLPDATTLPPAFVDAVSVDLFKALSIPLRAGRGFAAADDAQAPPVVVLSETTARRYFGAADPVGRLLKLTNGSPVRFQVVGVVGDVRRSGVTAEIPLQVYQPFAQRPPPYATLMVRTALPPTTLTKTVQAALWRIDPDLPITDVGTMDAFVNRSMTQPRIHFVLFALFALLALLLAAVGLYGLIAYGVEQRTREFGIRTALGASAREVLALVFREGARLIAGGVVLGIAGAWLAARLLRSMIFDVSEHDPAVFLLVPLVLAVVGALACWLPARRAARVDPMVALRSE